MTKFPLLKLKYFIQIIFILSITLFFTGCSSSSLSVKRIEANPLELKLINSTKKGNLDELKALLANKAVRINAQDYYGKTALMYACINNHLKIVKILLKKGANPNIVADSTRSAIKVNAFKKNVSANINIETYRKTLKSYYFNATHGYSALMYASENNNTAIMKLLIKNKANLNQKDRLGSTAFLKALEKSSYNAANLLIQKNADIRFTNKKMQTLFNLALKKKDLVRLNFLIELFSKKEAFFKSEVYYKSDIFYNALKTENPKFIIPFLRAIKKGDVNYGIVKNFNYVLNKKNYNLVFLVLNEGIDDFDYSKSLTFALKNKDLNFIKKLYESKAVSKSFLNFIVLKVITEIDNDIYLLSEPIIAYLISKQICKQKTFNTILFSLAKAKNPDIVQAFLEDKANIDLDHYVFLKKGESSKNSVSIKLTMNRKIYKDAFLKVAEKGNLDLFKLFLSYYPKYDKYPKYRSEKDKDFSYVNLDYNYNYKRLKRELFEKSGRSGNLEIMSILLKKQETNNNKWLFNDNTLISRMNVFKSCKEAIIKDRLKAFIFLTKIINVNKKEWVSFLDLAVSYSSYTIAFYLLSYMAVEPHGEYLIKAIKNNDFKMVRILIMKGANVNYQDSDLKTPLDHAQNSSEKIRNLLENQGGVATIATENKSDSDLRSQIGSFLIKSAFELLKPSKKHRRRYYRRRRHGSHSR